MHIFDRFRSLVPNRLLYVHYALSFCLDSIFKGRLYQLLPLKIFYEGSPCTVSPWHLFFVVHSAVYLVHLVYSGSSRSALKFLKQSFYVEFLEGFLKLWILIFSYDPLLSCWFLHIFIHFLSERFTLTSHFLRHCLKIFIIPHSCYLLLSVIIFALVGVL